MKYDVDELKFCGLVGTVSEEDYSASITEDEQLILAKSIYARYKSEYSPKSKRAWISNVLKDYFVSVLVPPVWIERSTVPVWPFLNGKPMIFIHQYRVPDNGISSKHLFPSAVLYVFGGKYADQDMPDKYEMHYRVIEQVEGL